MAVNGDPQSTFRLLSITPVADAPFLLGRIGEIDADERRAFGSISKGYKSDTVRDLVRIAREDGSTLSLFPDRSGPIAGFALVPSAAGPVVLDSSYSEAVQMRVDGVAEPDETTAPPAHAIIVLDPDGDEDDDDTRSLYIADFVSGEGGVVATGLGVIYYAEMPAADQLAVFVRTKAGDTLLNIDLRTRTLVKRTSIDFGE